MEIKDKKILLGIVAFEMFMVAALGVALIALIQRVHHQTNPLFRHLKNLVQQSFNLTNLDGRKICFYLSLTSGAIALSTLSLGSALAIKALRLKEQKSETTSITIEYRDSEEETFEIKGSYYTSGDENS